MLLAKKYLNTLRLVQGNRKEMKALTDLYVKLNYILLKMDVDDESILIVFNDKSLLHVNFSNSTALPISPDIAIQYIFEELEIGGVIIDELKSCLADLKDNNDNSNKI